MRFEKELTMCIKQNFFYEHISQVTAEQWAMIVHARLCALAHARVPFRLLNVCVCCVFYCFIMFYIFNL